MGVSDRFYANSLHLGSQTSFQMILTILIEKSLSCFLFPLGQPYIFV